MNEHPNPAAAVASAATINARASRMLQYVNEERIYLYTDGAWRAYNTGSTAVMQRIQDAFASPDRFQVWVWYDGSTASTVQITSV